MLVKANVYIIVNKNEYMCEVLSVRIPKKLKEKMKKYPNFNWKKVIIETIEEKIRELESEKILRELDEINRDVEVSNIPAWKSVREDRDAGH